MTTHLSFIERYRQLIQIPTISSLNEKYDISNKALIELLAYWFSDLGFKTEIIAINGSHQKYNLLATYGEGDGGLLLAGHTDTVPYDEGLWNFNPFQLTEKEGKFYGLGTADMKGFFAFVVDVLNQIDLAKLKKPLRILATADEETTMLGARTFSQHAHIRPDCAIIGEPTSLKPIRAHKGHLAQTVQVIGKSGHSSNPANGINAIEIMYEVVGNLLQLKNSLKQKYHNELFCVSYPTLNFGNIHGGDALNRICACCELQLEVRPLPNLAIQDAEDLVRQYLAPLIETWGDRIQVKALHAGIPGYECEHSAQIVKVVEKLLGEECKAVNYCTEAPFIQQLCPTLILGPGNIEQAHQPNEYLDAKFIEPTRELLAKLIHHFC
ncbi:acetylornithine deacetylase [Glaesserella parasuis]|uniref:Acetylornithine deacetylase n=3 Tax=Glaesserella parasuis TaxID=738 RepID=B8F469_GLAP5|nr:acetylornithine deacetylase [Glaesserella parasuis]AGO15951.1 acetylornithine deacetylase [Glaesserella parasuis ZJ0906]ACL32121.1 acetylornithine deacetylase [Glaesserella parasuis SH0165]AIK16957.1 acetylornithine deacetylase [Glaesserella parasuis]AWY45539.1 acetylornithine deacetylase [Glaesserella parasuis 29755]EQA95993.1 acetylornithine deacetylase [Glaesserella parasuis 29755]